MGVILELKAGGDLEEMREKYLRIESPRADECMFCGGCESNCTQGLPIVEDMQNGRRLLEDS